jgi:hypothetical protein
VAGFAWVKIECVSVGMDGRTDGWMDGKKPNSSKRCGVACHSRRLALIRMNDPSYPEGYDSVTVVL